MPTKSKKSLVSPTKKTFTKPNLTFSLTQMTLRSSPNPKDGVDMSVIESAQNRLCINWQWTGNWHCHCTQNTAPCQWFGMCHHYRRFKTPPKQAQSVWTAIPDVDSLRIPVKYLANMLTTGMKPPVKLALKRLLAMRSYKRSQLVDKSWCPKRAR